MREDLIREIATELAELQKDFDARIFALNRKLRIALGDVKPAPKIVEFVGRDGITRPIKGKKR